MTDQPSSPSTDRLEPILDGVDHPALLAASTRLFRPLRRHLTALRQTPGVVCSWSRTVRQAWQDAAKGNEATTVLGGYGNQSYEYWSTIVGGDSAYCAVTRNPVTGDYQAAVCGEATLSDPDQDSASLFTIS